ncbi:RNA polymerase-associated LEO1 [Hyphodiscus hymeniophilus]|uniref:RNA polymerase-associated LEO1 n=1 Tax=Hyphodiscus hymeniophilus TaxID=353542 RepID=A0A9P7AXX2_9HELO|nr:RNA polymerase-associated LEO1 [Hyphodiscus hymeniophilus]
MASISDDDMMAGEGDDLFGSEAGSEKVRELSDRELDSGDDEEGLDSAAPKEIQETDYDIKNATILDSTVWRHPVPRPAKGEFDILRLPKFLGIEPLAYDPVTFELPNADHHSDTKSANFSASATAGSTMRYRTNTSGKLESNTVVYKWSDGSSTIAVGNQHFVLQTKPLAPSKDSKTYQEVQDSHSYIASPSIASQLLVMVGHLTNQHTVRPNKDIEDDALEKLQRGLAAAARGSSKRDVKDGPALIMNTQDPELQKKQAELAEKDRLRAQRRRETAAEKASLGVTRRPGMGGLNVDDLEGRGGRRPTGSGRKPSGPKRARRRPEYDSDDDLPRGRTREDEYDKEDDFLADSDEELEVGDDDEDDDEMVDDESEKEQPKAKKQKTQSKPEELSDADADAEADLEDDEAPAPGTSSEPTGGRGRKGRNIIEDDDDE